MYWIVYVDIRKDVLFVPLFSFSLAITCSCCVSLIIDKWHLCVIHWVCCLCTLRKGFTRNALVAINIVIGVLSCTIFWHFHWGFSTQLYFWGLSAFIWTPHSKLSHIAALSVDFHVFLCARYPRTNNTTSSKARGSSEFVGPISHHSYPPYKDIPAVYIMLIPAAFPSDTVQWYFILLWKVAFGVHHWQSSEIWRPWNKNMLCSHTWTSPCFTDNVWSLEGSTKLQMSQYLRTNQPGPILKSSNERLNTFIINYTESTVY